MNRRILHVAILASLLVPIGAVAGGETHPFSVHDMLAMDRISDPQVSPDNARVIFVRRTTDLEANRGRTDLWLVNLDGQGMRRLTSHEAGDWNPRWSPDGKTIWFLSTRSGSSQVWRIAADGGEAEQFTDLPLDIGSLAMSPTGSHIAISMDVYPDANSPEETKARLEEIASSDVTGRIYDGIFIRHWDTWKDGRRSHVFVMSTVGRTRGLHSTATQMRGITGMKASREAAHETLVDVMRGMDADCPTKPFGGTEDYTFSPQGRSIIFAARDVGREEAWSTDFDLYAVPIDGSETPRCLTEDNQAWDASPVFSPDGRWLAYLAMERPRYESDRFRIILRPWEEFPAAQQRPQRKTRILTRDWDRSVRSFAWAGDGRTIVTNAANLGNTSLFAIDVATGDVTHTLSHWGSVGALAAAGDRVVYGFDDLKSPVELLWVSVDGEKSGTVTDINADKVRAARMGEFQQFKFRGWNDETVYGYVVKPVDFQPNRKYPVAFLIHGGPQGSFGNHFHYRWNPQAYAGAGYAAVMVDFHGSTGYGQAFCDSIRGDWGGKPLEDLQKGLAFALKKYSWLDGDRVSALGASFGGFMINWIEGNWPDRFRCLVNHDGNLDERLAYYDTEELWFPEWDHMGTPWDNPQGYSKHNPINYVKNWKTPMLVIHGALDYRVVDTQGISTFTALQRRGIPSKLLYFHDENHWVLQPANSILWHETVIAWLDQWGK